MRGARKSSFRSCTSAPAWSRSNVSFDANRFQEQQRGQDRSQRGHSGKPPLRRSTCLPQGSCNSLHAASDRCGIYLNRESSVSLLPGLTEAPRAQEELTVRKQQQCCLQQPANNDRQSCSLAQSCLSSTAALSCRQVHNEGSTPLIHCMDGPALSERKEMDIDASGLRRSFGSKRVSFESAVHSNVLCSGCQDQAPGSLWKDDGCASGASSGIFGSDEIVAMLSDSCDSFLGKYPAHDSSETAKAPARLQQHQSHASRPSSIPWSILPTVQCIDIANQSMTCYWPDEATQYRKWMPDISVAPIHTAHSCSGRAAPVDKHKEYSDLAMNRQSTQSCVTKESSSLGCTSPSGSVLEDLKDLFSNTADSLTSFNNYSAGDVSPIIIDTTPWQELVFHGSPSTVKSLNSSTAESLSSFSDHSEGHVSPVIIDVTPWPELVFHGSPSSRLNSLRN